MKVGLLLGSFNPVHRGHVEVAKFALSSKLVDQVWCVVSPQNPLKDTAQVSFDHRLKMVQLAFEGCDNVSVSDIESSMPSPSYTYNTIIKLKHDFPQSHFFILCGSDIVSQLDLWYRIDDLKKEVEFLVYPRGRGICSTSFIGAELVNISSSELRQNIESIYFPSSVYEYILQNDLYLEAWNAKCYYDKGVTEYAQGQFGIALNSLNKAIKLDGNYFAAVEMADLVRDILAYRYTDIYNP